jgi:hypothetical protein
MPTKTAEITIPPRCYLVGSTVHEVEYNASKSLLAWLDQCKVEAFHSVTGRESWFYLFNTSHMRGFIAHSETVLQGRWNGPGWYHTSMRRVKGQKWLTLSKGDIFEAFKRRFKVSDAERERFEAFILRLRKS